MACPIPSLAKQVNAGYKYARRLHIHVSSHIEDLRVKEPWHLPRAAPVTTATFPLFAEPMVSGAMAG